MEYTLVIKVKYGDTLRRFSAHVNKTGVLDLDMAGLRAKILGLFKLPPESDIRLTYIDEDGDVVALVDDDDLRDVTRQLLKVLRVDVQLNNEKFGNYYANRSGSSTPMGSPGIQNQLPCIDNAVAEVLKSVPEPLCEVLSKLSLDLASKTMSSNAMLAELVDCFSKVGQSSPRAGVQTQDGTDSNAQAARSEIPTAPSASTVPNAPKDGDTQALPKSNSISQKTSIKNVTRGVDVGAPVTTVPAPIDLNLDPPHDTNVNSGHSACYRPVGGRKETKADTGKSIFGSFSTYSNEWPFGVPMPLPYESPENPVLVPRSRRGDCRNDPMVGIFHRGVQCDGCGVHPIAGPRYKSKIKEDHDLCSICFAEMGNEADYIKIDRPSSYCHPRPLKALHDQMQKLQRHWPPPPPHVMRGCGIKPVRPTLDSRFILDVNVLDNTMMAPSTPFTKIWRFCNNGSVAWPQGVRLVWIGGDKFSHADSVEIEIPADGVPVDGELDIAVDFIAPELPGGYISYWRMATPSGLKFGQRVWVLIRVDASLQDSSSNSLEDLKLNYLPLSPDCSGSEGPLISDINVQHVVDGSFLKPSSSPSVQEPINPVVDEQTKIQDLDFPFLDNSSPSHVPSSVPYPIMGVSSPAPSNVSSSVSYPIIDLSEAAPCVPVQPLSATDTPTSPNSVKDAVEKALLKELEDMGFKQVDLNKEILRMNEYNLEQSLDDLCGFAEWDPILDELQEMGFCDKEMNRKLLKKNNGSIKRVVMDILNGEKA